MQTPKRVIHTEISVGSDPELFIFDPKTEKFVSAIDKIGGTKDMPLPVGNQYGFFVQEDNVLAEFNVPPSYSEQAFVGNILQGIEHVRSKVVPMGLDIKIQASAFMPEEALQDSRALVFGCDPDFNAWKNGKVNLPPPPEARSGTLRSAGGHLSVGYILTDTDVIKKAVDQNIVRWCDLYLGVPSVIMDEDTERKKLYGKAGAYRSKEWGVEYRTLSSFWLASPKKIAWAYRNLKKAVEKAGNSEFIDPTLGKRIQAAINTANKDLARDIIHTHDLELCE